MRRLGVVLALVGLLAVPAAIAPAQESVLLDTVTIPMLSRTPVAPKIALEDVLYTFEFSGTIKEEHSNGMRTKEYDTFYCFRSTNPLSPCSPPDGDGVSLQFLEVKGAGSATANPKQSYRPDHVYRLKYFGTGQVPTFASEWLQRRGTSCDEPAETCSGGWTVKIYGPKAGSAGEPAILGTGGKGDVKIQKASGGWESATAGVKLEPGDKLHTGFKSTVVVRLPDGHVIEVRPMTMILVQKNGPYMLTVGEVGAQVGRKGRGASDFTIQTPATTTSIRGTVFSVIYDPPTRTAVYFLKSGSIVVTPNGKAPITMKPGQEIEVSPKGVAKGTYDRAGTPAGVIGRRKATALVVAALKSAEKPCQLDASIQTGLISLAHVAGGWRASATLRGPASKLAIWTIKGSKLNPANADAAEITSRCR